MYEEDYQAIFMTNVSICEDEVLEMLPCGFKKAVNSIEENIGRDYNYCCAILFSIIEENSIINDKGFLKRR